MPQRANNGTAVDSICNGNWYVDRKLDITIPNPPNVEIRRKPIEEQLTHVLDNILSPVPENNEDLVIFSLEFLMT